MERKRAIVRALQDCGAPANLRGFSMTVAALEIFMEKQCSMGELYKEVAERFNTWPSRVERNIRSLVEACFARGNTEDTKKYFGNSIHPERGKATNSEFICAISYYLSAEESSSKSNSVMV